MASGLHPWPASPQAHLTLCLLLCRVPVTLFSIAWTVWLVTFSPFSALLPLILVNLMVFLQCATRIPHPGPYVTSVTTCLAFPAPPSRLSLSLALHMVRLGDVTSLSSS